MLLNILNFRVATNQKFNKEEKNEDKEKGDNRQNENNNKQN